MKKIILIIFVYFTFLTDIYSQYYPTYKLRAMNFSLNSPKNNFFEFDIYIEHTNPETLFEYAGGMYFFSFNPYVTLNIGELKCSIIDSDLPPMFRPRIGNTQGGPIHTVQNPKQYSIRLAINTFPGYGGYIIPDSGYPGTKVARVRIERVNGSFKNFHFNLAWRNPPIATFSTKIFAYVGTTNTDITTPEKHFIDSSGISSAFANIKESNLFLFPEIRENYNINFEKNILLDSYSGNTGNISFDNNQFEHIKLFESFSYSEFPPAGWRTIVKDTGVGSWYRSVYNYRTGGGGVESDYSPYGGCNYLISKRFVPSIEDSLIFYFNQYFTNVYNDSLEIFISNKDSLLSSFTTRLLILKDGVDYPPAGSWKRFSLYLGNYSGQTVWLAFRHSDYDGDNIRLDDIQIGRAVSQQISIENKFPYDTTCTDNPVVPYAIFTNTGSDNIQSFQVQYAISNNSNYISTKSIDLLNAGQSITVYFDTLTFSDTGTYISTITSSIPSQRSEQYYFYVTPRNWGYGGNDIWWANSEQLGLPFSFRKPVFSWRDTTGSVSLFVNGVLVSDLYVGTSYAGELRDGYFNLGNLLAQETNNKCVKLNGESYDGIYPAVDGIIGLTKNNTPPLNISSSDVGFDNCPAPAIYVLWMNMYLKPQSENRLSYKINPDTTELIITWDKVSVYYSSTSRVMSFQACIELMDKSSFDTRNSNIRFNFADTSFNRTSSDLINAYSNFGFGSYTSYNRHISGLNPNHSGSILYYRYRFGDYYYPNQFMKWKSGPLYEAPGKKSLSVEFGSNPDFLYRFDNKILDLNLLIEGMQKNTLPRSRDTVNVVIRKPVSPYQIIESERIFLDTSGSKQIEFSGLSSASDYYITIEHRNSIKTWSAVPVNFNQDTVLYDFTISINQAYMNNMTLVNGKACIYSGDINQDGVIDAVDLGIIDNDILNFASGNYLITDLNRDGVTDSNDAVIAGNNAEKFIQEIHPP